MTEDMHAAGTFCWIELGTNDIDAALDFYRQIYGWTKREVPMPGNAGGTYTMLLVDDREIGGVHVLGPHEKAAGVPPHFGTYVAVDDVDAGAADIQAAGGKVLAEPFDIPNIGRMAVAQDPTGATFSIWLNSSAHRGAAKLERNTVGTNCWNELITDNIDRAGSFYSKVFGWQPKFSEMNGFQYTQLMIEDLPVAGMMAKSPEMGPMPSTWVSYFVVDSADDKVALAEKIGGRVYVPAMDIDGVGRFAWIADPQGAVSGLLQPADR
ncbi:MAG: VOC family protein [Myxococcales bacterium]|nr:VOC family protein [Myxococcales bacterium]